MKKKILITGGTGTLGINLVKKLLQTNHKIFLIYRNKKKLFPFKGYEKKINFVKLDLSNKNLLKKKILKIKPNIVFHLASSFFNPPILNFEQHLNDNFFNTLNLLETLKKIRLEKFIFAGSAAVYREGKNLTEGSKYSYENDYGISKLLSSKLLTFYKNIYNFPAVELRYFSIYGDWEKKNRLVMSAINLGLKKKNFIFYSENQLRDYIYVDDAVDALLQAFKNKKIKGIFNICSSKTQGTHNLVKIIYKKLGLKNHKIKKNLNIKQNTIKKLVGNNSKAKKLLKWNQKFLIEDGIEKTIRWAKN